VAVGKATTILAQSGRTEEDRGSASKGDWNHQQSWGKRKSKGSDGDEYQERPWHHQGKGNVACKDSTYSSTGWHQKLAELKPRLLVAGGTTAWSRPGGRQQSGA